MEISQNLVIENFKNKKKTIFLFIQGGPSPIKALDPNLDIKTIPHWLIDFVKDVKTFFNINFKEYNYVQFCQTINFNEKLISSKNLSLIDADKENEINIDNLHKVIKHYYKKGFKIILFGHSLGGMLALKYFHKYKDKLLFKSIIANCRLNTPQFIVDNLLKHQKITYLNQLGTIKKTEKLQKMGYSNLFSSLTLPRYQKLLKNMDLQNVLFVTCEGDARFGVLDQEEQNFIKNKNGQIIYNTWNQILAFQKKFHPQLVSEFLAHSSVFYSFNIKVLKDMVEL